MKILRSILIVWALSTLFACASLPNPNASRDPPPAPATKVAADYKIGVTDVLQVSAWRTPDISVASVPVAPDGTVSLPLIGNVQVAGMTNEQAAKVIQDKYLKYVKDPQITITVLQSNSQEYLTNVRVGGAVRTPSSVPYHQGATVIDVIIHSGGPNDIADPNRTVLHRMVNGKTGVYAINLDDVISGKDLSTNYPVYPGDIITVPEKSMPITTTTPIATLAALVPWMLLIGL